MNQDLKHFNVIYINFEKVFEIAMLFDNEIVISKEKGENSTHQGRLAAKISGLLTGVFNASGKGEYEFSKENNLLKTVEIKSTNAVVLRDLISKIDAKNEPASDLVEGQVIILDNINLSLENEEETRNMKMIKQGLLDKFTHEDISIGELLKKVGEDYSYYVTTKKNEDDYIFKIPSEMESEFENKYTIDDLFLGSTSIIGIYKGTQLRSDLQSTFTYLTSEKQRKSEITYSQRENNIEKNEKQSSENMYHYLDILAVVQRINFSSLY